MTYDIMKTILVSKREPKEKTEDLVEAVIRKNIPIRDFLDHFRSASRTERGTCADAMKHISAQSPDLLAPHIDEIIPCITDPLPRVKWGVQEAIGNLSCRYPEDAARAIPKLLLNTENPGTVVRWCAAYALSEIVKHSTEVRKSLVPKIKEIMKKEENNGVRGVYQKISKYISEINPVFNNFDIK
jgi:hypothetical protein